MKQSYYYENTEYSEILNNQQTINFTYYVENIKKLLPDNGVFVDIGCGTGIVVNAIAEQNPESIGLDISPVFLESARKRKGKYLQYDGSTFPIQSQSVDVVGSFNVLEHVEDIEKVLAESVRILKPNGYLIIMAPNFLSISNSYTRRTRGFLRKIKNILIAISKIVQYVVFKKYSWQTFPPVVNKTFEPDDDATNLINPFDIIFWARENKFKIISLTGNTQPGHPLVNKLSQLPITKYMMGSVNVILHKRSQ